MSLLNVGSTTNYNYRYLLPVTLGVVVVLCPVVVVLCPVTVSDIFIVKKLDFFQHNSKKQRPYQKYVKVAIDKILTFFILYLRGI
jgi:hypothetical protein